MRRGCVRLYQCFNTLPRGQVCEAVHGRVPALSQTASACLFTCIGMGLAFAAPSRPPRESPAIFALGVADALESIRARPVVVDPKANVFVYLDDVVV
eukprot:3524551-Karenia_brevis.AAC.1